MRRPILACALFLAGCSGGSEPPQPAGGDDRPASPAPAPKAEERDLFAAIAAHEIRVHLLREDYSATVHGATLHVGNFGSGFFLEADATVGRRFMVRCPRYVFATTLDDWKNPHASEAPAPPAFYLVVPPAEFLVVDRGTKVQVERVWYLGNAERPPPMSQGSQDTRFRLVEVPADSPFVRLAEAIEDSGTSVPNGGQGLFSLLAHATPPAVLEQMLLSRPRTEIRTLHDVLVAAGLPEADHPAFERAEARWRGVRDALEAGRLEGGDGEFFAGDAEIARAVSDLLRAAPDGPSSRAGVATLVQLGVRDPAVWAALLETALSAAEEDARFEAALAGGTLGDPRVAPILLQYLFHPERGDDDIDRRIRQSREVLEALGQKGGASWEEALAASDLAGSPELPRLREFLSSRKNLRPDAFDALCRTLEGSGSHEERYQALRRLTRSEVWRGEPRVREVALAVLSGDPDRSLRSEVIVALHRLGDPPEADPSLVDVLESYLGRAIEDNEDSNLLGAAMNAAARRRTAAATGVLERWAAAGDARWSRRAREALDEIRKPGR